VTLSVLYLLILVPGFALVAGAYAIVSTQKSAERVREIERQRSAH